MSIIGVIIKSTLDVPRDFILMTDLLAKNMGFDSDAGTKDHADQQTGRACSLARVHSLQKRRSPTVTRVQYENVG